MKKLLISIFVLFPVLVFGQTETENYIKTTSYQVETEVEGVSEDNKIEAVNYFDGLGRPLQSVSQRAGANREDLITPVYYDGLGRQPLDYLPLPITTLGGDFYVPQNGTVEEELKGYYKAKFPKDFYQGSGLYPDGWDNPYSEKIIENSPLNRVLEQGAPGMEWRVQSGGEHTIKFEYGTNIANEVVNYYVSFLGSDPVLNANGFYPANELHKNTIKDENWKAADGIFGITYEFTNKLGQIVLKRSSVLDINKGTQDPNYHDTYYVYDDYGNLTFVISPEASENIVDNLGVLITGIPFNTILSELCYQYKYDHRNRLTDKKIPGKGWEFIIYDSLDRPVLTQDVILREDDKWLFTKYDDFGRVVYTGIYTNETESREQIEGFFLGPQTISEDKTTIATNIGGTSVYYSNFALPIYNLEVLTVNYYDSYIDTQTDLGTMNLPISVHGVLVSNQPKGLPTVSRVKVLVDTSNDWIVSITGYDAKGRTIYSRSINEYLDTDDISHSQLDFTGKVIESNSTHNKTGLPIVYVYDYYFYDHMGRLLSHKQKLDNEPVQLIVDNTYDELGQLIRKDVGGESYVDGYTDLTNVDVTFDGTVVSTDSNYNWPSYLKTKGKIPKEYNGGIKATVLEDDKYVRVGLVRSSTVNNNNEYFDYGLGTYYDSGTSEFRIGIIQSSTGTTGNYGSYDVGDILKVERVGSLIKFYKNTSLLSSIAASDDALVGKLAFSGPVGSVEDLTLFGTMIDKKLQNVDYKYNVRGWLTTINEVDGVLGFNTDLFMFRINYNRLDGSSPSGDLLYNGNISQTLWKSNYTDKSVRSYIYGYDDLNRIKTASGYKGTTSATMTTHSAHDVSQISYDQNGNIQTLIRNGSNDDGTSSGQWDNLQYTYENTYSNRLTKVDDSSLSNLASYGFNDGYTGAVDYEYDDNGNLTRDRNKSITAISYNHLNLPTQINFDIGGNTPSIEYVYDATGVKLEKRVVDEGSHSTYYAGNYIYDGVGVSAAQLQFFSHPEGYIKPVADTEEEVKGSTGGETTYSAFKYVFQYKDHLGNVRLSYADGDLDGSINAGSEIIEESNYYPFGLKQKGYNNDVSSNGNSLAQKWKFQGQEKNEDLDLNVYEFKWRINDPAIGRFWQIDPLAEDYVHNSTYAFSENRPIDGIELEGLEHLSHTVYSVHKDYKGNYNARYDRTANQQNVGDWSGTKSQNTYNVYDSKGNVTAIYSGDNSQRDMSNAGITLSSVKGRNVSASDIIEGAKNNSEFQKAGETLENVATVGGMVLSGGAIGGATTVGKIILGADVIMGADDLSSGLTDNGNTVMENTIGEKTTAGIKAVVNTANAGKGGLDAVSSKGVVNKATDITGVVIDAASAKTNAQTVIKDDEKQ